MKKAPMTTSELARYVRAATVLLFLTGCGGGGGSIAPVPANAPGGTAASAMLRAAESRMLEPPLPPYKELYSFAGGTDGAQPFGLVALNGTLYGMTENGGASNLGTVFSVTPAGTEHVLYSFKGGNDGEYPFLESLVAVNGILYGTTSEGGTGKCPDNGGGTCGTVFSVTTSGKESVLYSFAGGKDGSDPNSLIDVNGTLYGTTLVGGGTGCPLHDGCGTVFSVTTTGKESVLYRFAGGTDGFAPFAGLTVLNGTLYGTTDAGGGTTGCESGQGDTSCGTVFAVTTAGKEHVVYRFASGADAQNPQAGLIAVGGVLYGTSSQGGTGKQGTVYRVSTAGSEKVLHNFSGLTDGEYPTAALTDANGTLYGTALGGTGSCGPIGCGVVFSISTSGTEKVVYDFKGPPDGDAPDSGLLDVDGTLYGTTVLGGSGSCSQNGQGCGSVFKI